jgi:predicted acetyltransferase
MPSRIPPHQAEPRLAYATEQEAESYVAAVSRGFHQDYVAEHWEVEKKVLEWDRSFGLKVEDRWIATCGAYSRVMTVPGGQVPVAAVTIVTVAPAYRRRGLLTQMMKHQLEDVQQRGSEPVALLWASESLIYGRYGYGHVAPRVSMSGPTRSTAFLPALQQAPGSVDEVTRDEFLAAAPELHSRLLAERPGGLNRSPQWWDVGLYDPEAWRHGATALRYVLHFDDAGSVDGYASFRLADGPSSDEAGREVRIGELDAAGAGSYAGLWRYLLDLDLVRSFSRRNAPADEPLRYLVADQRAIKTELQDATYARLVNLPAALEARSYSDDLDLVIEVRDQLLPANDGLFRLEVVGGAGRVTRTERSPDLTLATRELGASYLGGTSLNALHRAGLVEEHTPGLVAKMSAAFSWPTPPFCPDFF